jgi:hypothetical protein
MKANPVTVARQTDLVPYYDPFFSKIYLFGV